MRYSFEIVALCNTSLLGGRFVPNLCWSGNPYQIFAKPGKVYIKKIPSSSFYTKSNPTPLFTCLKFAKFRKISYAFIITHNNCLTCNIFKKSH